MSSPLPVIVLGLLAIALVGAPSSGAGGATTQGTSGPSAGTIAEGATGDDFFLTGGNWKRQDLCGVGEERRAWTPEELACVAEFRAGRAQRFVDQVWTPASRVPISSLTAEDFAFALRFLANGMNRQNVPLTEDQQRAIDEYNDNGAVQFMSVIAPIASALTFGLAKKAEDANEQGKQDYRDYIVGGLPLPSHPLLRPLKLWPAPASCTGDDGIFYCGTGIDSRGPSMTFGFDPLKAPSGTVYVRMGLLAEWTHAWALPWVSQEMGYRSVDDRVLNEEKIVRAARLFRTFDVIGASVYSQRQSVFTGDAPEGAEAISITDTTVNYRLAIPDLYAYKVGGRELWGCVLPAAPEDNAYDLKGELGRTLASADYVGKKVSIPLDESRSAYVPYTPPPESPPATLSKLNLIKRRT